jgi:hypothetical protein
MLLKQGDFIWRAWGKYAIVNVPFTKKEIDKVHRLNGYSICKAFIQGVPIYSLYKLPDIWIGNFKSSQEAKDKLTDILTKGVEK